MKILFYFLIILFCSCNNNNGYDKYKDSDFSYMEGSRIQTRGIKVDTIIYVIDFPYDTLNNSGYGVYVSKNKDYIYRIVNLNETSKNENILESRLDSLMQAFLQYDLYFIDYEISGDVCIGIDNFEDIFCKCLNENKLNKSRNCEFNEWYIK